MGNIVVADAQVLHNLCVCKVKLWIEKREEQEVLPTIHLDLNVCCILDIMHSGTF